MPALFGKVNKWLQFRRTAHPLGQNAGHVLRGGVARLRMRQKMNEWIQAHLDLLLCMRLIDDTLVQQISSVDGRYARYVISVQDAVQPSSICPQCFSFASI